MSYFKEEHHLFRQSLKEFLEREVSPNLEVWEKMVKSQSPFGKKWVKWVF